MLPLATLPLFCAAAALIIVAPGPDTLYIMARSVGQGRRAGVVSVAGIFCGLMAQLAAAALGVSALIAASRAVFTAIRWAGALYLLYLGARILLARPAGASGGGAALALDRASLYRVFAQGLVTNLLNPKVALFFIAFLPQFAVARLGHVGLQIFTLGAVFSAAGTAWNMVTALTAGAVGDWLRRNPRVAAVQQRVTGLIFVGLGLRIALVAHG